MILCRYNYGHYRYFYHPLITDLVMKATVRKEIIKHKSIGHTVRYSTCYFKTTYYVVPTIIILELKTLTVDKLAFRKPTTIKTACRFTMTQ